MAQTLSKKRLLGLVAAPATGGGGAPSFSVAGLAKWSAAVDAAAKGGSVDPVVLYVGDSITRGQGANSAAATGNDMAFNHIAQLAGMTYGGLSAQWDALMATGSTAYAAYPAFDNRVTAGAVAATLGSTGSECLGGFVIRGNIVGGFYNIAPLQQVDTFDVWFLKTSGAGVLGLAVDGGAVTPVNTANATTQYVKQTITCPLGFRTLNMSLVSGARADICQVIAYNSTVRKVRFYNAGIPGAKAADIALSVNPQNALNAFDEMAPHLVIIQLGTNEANQASLLAEATFKAQMQSLINAALAANADVILQTPPPMGNANGLANMPTVQQWVKDLATTNGLVLSDLYARWGTYAASVSKFRDTVHPNGTGYTDIKALQAPLIGAV